MRALARELGAPPMTIYNYVPNKEALRDLVVTHILREIRVPKTSEGTWEERLKQVEREARSRVFGPSWSCIPVWRWRKSRGVAGSETAFSKSSEMVVSTMMRRSSALRRSTSLLGASSFLMPWIRQRMVRRFGSHWKA